jgi:hypothetical protein
MVCECNVKDTCLWEVMMSSKITEGEKRMVLGHQT